MRARAWPTRLTGVVWLADDADARDIFEIALEESDSSFSLTAIASSLKALEALSAGNTVPDFIFLDLNMPLLSGKECLREIRNIDTLEHVPVVIYSTSSYIKDIEETKMLGANHFLSKTPDIRRLSEILSELFSGKDLPYELS